MEDAKAFLRQVLEVQPMQALLHISVAAHLHEQPDVGKLAHEVALVASSDQVLSATRKTHALSDAYRLGPLPRDVELEKKWAGGPQCESKMRDLIEAAASETPTHQLPAQEHQRACLVGRLRSALRRLSLDVSMERYYYVHDKMLLGVTWTELACFPAFCVVKLARCVAHVHKKKDSVGRTLADVAAQSVMAPWLAEDGGGGGEGGEEAHFLGWHVMFGNAADPGAKVGLEERLMTNIRDGFEDALALVRQHWLEALAIVARESDGCGDSFDHALHQGALLLVVGRMQAPADVKAVPPPMLEDACKFLCSRDISRFKAFVGLCQDEALRRTVLKVGHSAFRSANYLQEALGLVKMGVQDLADFQLMYPQPAQTWGVPALFEDDWASMKLASETSSVTALVKSPSLPDALNILRHMSRGERMQCASSGVVRGTVGEKLRSLGDGSLGVLDRAVLLGPSPDGSLRDDRTRM